MSKRIIKAFRNEQGQTVVVRYDTEWQEYTCEIKGSPDATYFTDDKADALSTAEVMLKDLELSLAVEELLTTIPGQLS